MKKTTKIILGVVVGIVIVLVLLMYFNVLDFHAITQTALGGDGSSADSEIVMGG